MGGPRKRGKGTKSAAVADNNGGKRWVAGVSPFFSLDRGSLVHFMTDHMTIDVSLPLSSITDPSALEMTVLRTVLHKKAASNNGGDDDEDNSARRRRRIIVDVVQMSPISNTVQQIAGTSSFKVSVLVTVRVAEVASLGVLIGVAVGGNQRPFPDTFRIRLTDTEAGTASSNGSSRTDADHASDAPIVLCRCGDDEPVSSGKAVVVAVEPNLVKCSAIRPPRVSPGTWAREVTDTHTLSIVFTLDMARQLGASSSSSQQQRQQIDPPSERSRAAPYTRPTSVGDDDNVVVTTKPINNKRQRFDSDDDE